MSTHAVVWIDHKEARVFHVRPDNVEETTIESPQHHVHKHPRGPGEGKEYPDDAKRFFHEVVQTLAGAEAILIVGPSTAKLELLRYAHKHNPDLEPRIVGIETVDHPTDGNIVAYARKYFRKTDRMAPR